MDMPDAFARRESIWRKALFVTRNRQPRLEQYFVAALVEVRRYRLRLTQIEFAQKLAARGVPITAAILTTIETGRRRVNLTDAYALAETAGMTLDEMVEMGKAL